MKIGYECLNCALGTFIGQIDKHIEDKDLIEENIRLYLRELSNFDFNMTPPDLGRLLHIRIRELLNNTDPYMEEKAYFNELILSKFDQLKEISDSSENPFHTALKMALIGNIIDYGSHNHFTADLIFRMCMESEITIDQSSELEMEIENASNILYLGDNCGEIVFDRLFIETILSKFPGKNIIFAVRGFPIINDATKKEAEMVGMDKIVKVIDNGFDAPGTVLNHCSEEFLKVYRSADLIISKGQGNFESLSDEKDNIFFLLMAKCAPVSKIFKVDIKSLIVCRNHFAR